MPPYREEVAENRGLQIGSGKFVQRMPKKAEVFFFRHGVFANREAGQEEFKQEVDFRDPPFFGLVAKFGATQKTPGARGKPKLFLNFTEQRVHGALTVLDVPAGEVGIFFALVLAEQHPAVFHADAADDEFDFFHGVCYRTRSSVPVSELTS